MPRGEKTSSNRSSQNPIALRASAAAPRTSRCVAGAGGQPRAAARQHEAPLEHVDRQGQHDRRHDERERPAVHEPPHRHDEDEKAQVVSEQRVHAAERRGVEVAQHRLPVDGGAHAGRDRDQQQHDRQESADQRLDDHAARQAELILELPDDVGRRRARGERQVRIEEDEHADRQRGEERPAQGQRLDEDFASSRPRRTTASRCRAARSGRRRPATSSRRSNNRIGCGRITDLRAPGSGAVRPGGQVLALRARQLVDRDAHRGELEPRDLEVDLARHDVHLLG